MPGSRDHRRDPVSVGALPELDEESGGDPEALTFGVDRKVVQNGDAGRFVRPHEKARGVVVSLGHEDFVRPGKARQIRLGARGNLGSVKAPRVEHLRAPRFDGDEVQQLRLLQLGDPDLLRRVAFVVRRRLHAPSIITRVRPCGSAAATKGATVRPMRGFGKMWPWVTAAAFIGVTGCSSVCDDAIDLCRRCSPDGVNCDNAFNNVDETFCETSIETFQAAEEMGGCPDDGEEPEPE